jgi:hypothetical protein
LGPFNNPRVDLLSQRRRRHSDRSHKRRDPQKRLPISISDAHIFLSATPATRNYTSSAGKIVLMI